MSPETVETNKRNCYLCPHKKNLCKSSSVKTLHLILKRDLWESCSDTAICRLYMEIIQENLHAHAQGASIFSTKSEEMI